MGGTAWANLAWAETRLVFVMRTRLTTVIHFFGVSKVTFFLSYSLSSTPPYITFLITINQIEAQVS